MFGVPDDEMRDILSLPLPSLDDVRKGADAARRGRAADCAPLDATTCRFDHVSGEKVPFSGVCTHGALAQLAEHCLCKAGVRGSIPLGSTSEAHAHEEHEPFSLWSVDQLSGGN